MIFLVWPVFLVLIRDIKGSADKSIITWAVIFISWYRALGGNIARRCSCSPCLPTACCWWGDHSSSIAASCLKKCPSSKKKWKTCKKTDTTPRREHGAWEKLGVNSWFQGRDPGAELPQAWIVTEHFVALYTWMFRELSPSGGTHCILCARRQPVWLAIKHLASVTVFPLGKMRLGSARDCVPMIASCLKSYQCSFLIILQSQVWLVFLSMRFESNLLFFLIPLKHWHFGFVRYFI